VEDVLEDERLILKIGFTFRGCGNMEIARGLKLNGDFVKKNIFSEDFAHVL
jgi:hypothetical protein